MKTKAGKKKVYVHEHDRIINEIEVRIGTHYRSTPCTDKCDKKRV